MPTDKLYYPDSYVTNFTARIVSSVVLPSGQAAVILDRTAFYPESGGQPADTGLINGVPVLDVQEKNGEILHILDICLKEEKVSATVDWARRFDHMQQHSGEHVLTGAFGKVLNASNTGFHLGQTSSQIDLDIDTLTAEQAAEVERAANTIVFKNTPIYIHFIDSSGLNKFPLRKQPTKHYDNLRLIEVPDFDCCPCGGTHVASTGEIGLIKIRSWERKKSGIRIDFVCGLRALADYQEKNETVKDLSAKLSVPPAELSTAYDKQAARLDTLNKELTTAQKELTHHLAHKLYAQSQLSGDWHIITHTQTNISPAALNDLARELIAYPAAVALLAGINADNTKAHLVFGANPALTAANMNAALKVALPHIDGKGGGSHQAAQGGGSNVEGIQQALAVARDFLLESK